MLNIAICDDNLPITSEIEYLLSAISNKMHIEIKPHIYFDGSTLISDIISEIYYDIIYMDIEMEQVDGITAAHHIRNMRLPTMLIYISAYDTYFPQLFEVEAFRFLAKPIDWDLFEKYFKEAYKKLSARNEYFTFQFNQITNKIPVADIIYFESQGRYIIVWTIRQQYRFIEKLKNINKNLYKLGFTFLRIHQSYLINPAYICSICLSKVVLCNNITLQISQKYKKQVQSQYLLLAEDS